MKLVREHINERFEEESDPIEDMGIGLSSEIAKSLTMIKDNYSTWVFGTELIYSFSLQNNNLVATCAQIIPSNLSTNIKNTFKKYGLDNYLDLTSFKTEEKSGYYFFIKIKPPYVSYFKTAITKVDKTRHGYFTTLPDDLIVRGNLDLDGVKITELPDNV
jgi:hypothetical protein